MKKTMEKMNKSSSGSESESELSGTSDSLSNKKEETSCSVSGSETESEIEEETSSESEEKSKKENPSLTVFIKGISYDLTEYDLKNEMEKIGKVVRVGIPMTNDYKRNKGFGYVEFSKEEDVKKALKLDGTVFLGREVVVNMAHPRENKQRHTIYISNIPFECDKRKLKKYFEEMGEVVGMSFPYDKENDRLKGYGFVDFGNKEDYEKVLKKKLVFEDSSIYQRPAYKNNKEDRKDFNGKGPRRNDSRWNGKRYGGESQNRNNNKKVKFNSDSEE
ncbi:RNA binding domain-containing protein [Encephalitozoon hellem ATCC 50504]|uniref:RNA binding domain-containing protein n=1 Tax=Encephalitozoon hellem TaxID=27973 RepID=A0A9Q9C3E0_ENCHE|nr:RNA binding domain-containing protein [Encephalitozoon hellem ATCC 50504]AFM97961.1 RNA binding domain-containing protein [Encephalitozoon hellem ATCC 50504]UTX42765.1 RNA binding domain-containing protein [Encephalitozoon hellem]WEL38224.1 RRM domain-containing protein [Encephalitozoon hellem]|eukprot:XP_003886942.1 RNA binding domain-containing protein [Encephalitozoon hellem ATCC 50504]